ncbi:MAG: protein translocase SEC61 complex subunit gamma [Candidatus Pacearchaeota archaeon]
MEWNVINFFRKCARVWVVLRKPTRDEWSMIAKVSAVGILVIGLLGFAVSLLLRFVA